MGIRGSGVFGRDGLLSFVLTLALGGVVYIAHNEMLVDGHNFPFPRLDDVYSFFVVKR
jgi:hypothetical protein